MQWELWGGVGPAGVLLRGAPVLLCCNILLLLVRDDPVSRVHRLCSHVLLFPIGEDPGGSQVLEALAQSVSEALDLGRILRPSVGAYLGGPDALEAPEQVGPEAPDAGGLFLLCLSRALPVLLRRPAGSVSGETSVPVRHSPTVGPGGGGDLPGLTRCLARPLVVAASGEPCILGRLPVREAPGPDVPSSPLFLLGGTCHLHLEFCNEGGPKGDLLGALAAGWAAEDHLRLAGLARVRRNDHNGPISVRAMSGAWKFGGPSPGACYRSPGGTAALPLSAHVVPEAGFGLEGPFSTGGAVPAHPPRASTVLILDVGAHVTLVPDHLAACGALGRPAGGLLLVGGGLPFPGRCGHPPAPPAGGGRGLLSAALPPSLPARGDLLISGGSSLGPSPLLVDSSWPSAASVPWMAVVSPSRAERLGGGASRMRGLLLLWLSTNSGTALTEALAPARLVQSPSWLSRLSQYLGKWPPVSPMVV